MLKICKQCGDQFDVSDDDLKFYEKISPVFDGKKFQIPPPTLCPVCRQQRRYSIRNERSLYKRSCDLCGKDTLSMYSSDLHTGQAGLPTRQAGKFFPVYCADCWWGDKWDGSTFVRDFDFDRSFFDQFVDLQEKVPRIGLYVVSSVNCDYCNFVGDVKNSYLVFGSVYSEDCMYGSPYYSKNCLDTLVLRECELCYECTDCRKLYNCMFCQDCNNSNDLLFCYDLQGCSDCIACSGLRNKKYHIGNEKYSKEEYEKYRSKVDFCNSEQVQNIKEKLKKLKIEVPHHYMPSKAVENVSGSHIFNSKNTLHSFFADNCAYCAQIVDLKDCYDNNYTEENELCLEYLGMYSVKKTSFSTFSRHCFDVFYSEYCISCKYLFGCVGLRNKEYCILNKQYSKEEYEKLVPRIIEHMKIGGEWGEFFPISRSVFGYNETVAHEYFPLSREEALSRGYKWKDVDPREYRSQKYEVPEQIKDVPNSILDDTLACRDCGKNYRIIKQELKFYHRMGLPIPKKCPNCRHRDRLNLRNPYHSVIRNCDSCGEEIETAYAKDVPFKVYCEKCYLKEVY